MIGAVGLLFLAVLVAAGPAQFSPLDVLRSSALDHATSRVGHCGGASTEGVPISLSIQNDGAHDDRLLGGRTPIARCVMVRRTRLVRGRPQTFPLPDGLVIPAGEVVTLEPLNTHLTLFGLQADLVQGETFPLTLYFDGAGEAIVVARVRRKVDAAGSTPLPSVSVGELTVALVSAQPAPAAMPAVASDKSLTASSCLRLGGTSKARGSSVAWGESHG